MRTIINTKLGKFAVFQNELFEMVRRGLLDPNAVEKAIKLLLALDDNLNPYLRLISGGQRVRVSACGGGINSNFLHSQKTFHDVDYEKWRFLKWGFDVHQKPTEETDVFVYEMRDKAASFKKLFTSLGLVKDLAFSSQEQVVKFASGNEEWLHSQYGRHTFLLFKLGDGLSNNLFVACIGCYKGKKKLTVHSFTREIQWGATRGHRVVVPVKK